MENNQIEIFKSSDGSPELHVRLVDDSIWLTQSQLVELSDLSKANISEHNQHIFQSGELDQDSTVRNFRKVQSYILSIFQTIILRGILGTCFYMLDEKLSGWFREYIICCEYKIEVYGYNAC